MFGYGVLKRELNLSEKTMLRHKKTVVLESQKWSSQEKATSLWTSRLQNCENMFVP
jgi:hypothetical protein